MSEARKYGALKYRTYLRLCRGGGGGQAGSELLMMSLIDFQFESLIIHVNESKSSLDNQLKEDH